MAAKKSRRPAKDDKIAAAAVKYFCARSHNAWRRQLLKTNPEQKGKPRMRLRGGVMVDVNQPWANLHPKAQADNKRAALDALAALEKFPRDREAAADFVHKCWIKRNKGDAAQPKELFKPYRALSELEKDKDRAHVDNMKAALKAVQARAVAGPKVKRRAKPRSKAVKSLALDAKQWARLEAAASALSDRIGRPVSPEALLSAGIDAIVAVCGAVGAKSKKR